MQTMGKSVDTILHHRCRISSFMEFTDVIVCWYAVWSALQSLTLTIELGTTIGMFTVSDIIHLIQYYYQSTSYEGAAADVERFRLESIRGKS